MTVRIVLAAVAVIPALFSSAALSSCQPKASQGDATGGRRGATGGARGGSSGDTGGILASGGGAGNAGTFESGGGESGAAGAGGGGATGIGASGGSSGKDAAAGGRDGAGLGQGGAAGKDANRGDAGRIDGGPATCDDTQGTGRLGVYFYNDAAVTGQAVQLHFDIVNFTAFGTPLSKVTVRYWFTDEEPATSNVVEQYYVPIPTKMKFASVNPPRVGADTMLEMSFGDPPDAAVSWVETRGFNFAFHKTGYSGSYDQSNDYSYDAKLTKALGPNPKITAYVNGVLAWGCEPPVQTTPIDASAEPAAPDSSIGSVDATIDSGS